MDPGTPTQRVARFLRRHDPDTAASLIVAVSGGVDSLALLLLLHAAVGPARLIVAHADHGLRDGSADDAAFVAARADELGVRCVVERLALSADTFTEAAGRAARYAFLARTARAHAAAAVLTGHHAGDQAETVLMHLLRGSGLAGLAGMRPVAIVPDDSGAPPLSLLRPLLNLPKSDLEAIVAARGWQAREDETNRETHLWRNRLRHELLPRLEQLAPGAAGRLTQLAAIVAADEAYLAAQTDAALDAVERQRGADWWQGERAAWLALPLALRRRVLRAVCMALTSAELSFAAVEAARALLEAGHAGRQAALAGDVVLTVGAATFTVGAADAFPLDDVPQLEVDGPVMLPLPGRVALAGGWWLSAEVVTRESGRAAGDPWTVVVALPPGARLTVRGRQPGEKMQPLGLDGRHASLKKIMIDRKLAAAARARWPIVAADDTPLWLAGHVLDHRFRLPGPPGARIVRLRCGAPSVPA